MRLLLERYASPMGQLLIVTDKDGALRALDFDDYEGRMQRLLSEHYGNYTLEDRAAPTEVREALDNYFAGDIDAFANIRVATGGTAFQRAVWQALRTIPAGQTKAYGQIAAQIDRPSAGRAVGAANGSNPVAIVVPCHRVIGANGTLTGYGGGLARKQWLLDHERRHCEARNEPMAGIEGTNAVLVR
jgi:methylated-DNA-[protein]-cysteine S-methyltransferase